MPALTGLLVFASGLALAADQDQTRTQDKDQTKAQTQDKTKTQDQIYGSQMMTEQERNEYRNRMRSAKTVQEQEQIRAEHHKSMQVRAKERGVTIPDHPPAKGGGMMGPGGGMGPGGYGRGWHRDLVVAWVRAVVANLDMNLMSSSANRE